MDINFKWNTSTPLCVNTYLEEYVNYGTFLVKLTYFFFQIHNNIAAIIICQHITLGNQIFF